MRLSNYLKLLFVLIFGFFQGQDIDLENIGKRTAETLKKNPFKISGGVSASSVFYQSNQNNSREAFTYFLNGNLNLGIYHWTLPISYSFTNQGSQLNYQIPWKFNRLSIHPKYKWIQAHIGDASMSFSPYTYNGLMFTGAGAELNPKIPLKLALIGGRLNKEVKENGNPQNIPAYKRTAYGAQIKWEQEKYKLGLIGFYAKDHNADLGILSADKEIFPQENLVISLNASFFIHKNVEVFGEFANSILTQNTQMEGSNHTRGIASSLLKGNASTQSFNAYNFGANLNLKNTALGIRYERIDPEYKTLGAYYFNNDLENITLNNNLTLFKGNLTLATSIGRQIDNLNEQKLKRTSRWVGSINANLKASDKLMITGSYSNFTMFTNKQLNQFTNINQNPLLLQQPKDSIDYKQIAQNTNLNINYIISQKKHLSQSINLNYSLNDMVNKENDIVRRGGISRFHNLAATYALGFPEKKMSIGVSVNYTHIYAASKVSTTFGPAVSVNKSFLEDKLQTSFGASYNRSNNRSINSNVINLRASANYSPWEKHSFNANVIQMLRNSNQQPKLNEITATIGYNYSF